jgi:hypothetical protein
MSTHTSDHFGIYLSRHAAPHADALTPVLSAQLLPPILGPAFHPRPAQYPTLTLDCSNP